MLSGRKRISREYQQSQPPKKRSKVDEQDHTKPTQTWPTKQKKLTRQQLAALPHLLNPSLHKAVFESFWNKAKFGAPIFEFDESASASDPKQKAFECQLTLINKGNKSQIISLSSSKFDSKKKAEIDVYQQFNLNYIPFQMLLSKMTPFAFKSKVSAEQLMHRKGDYLKDKTSSIVIEPLPLECSEVDIVSKLVRQREAIEFIAFERDSDRAIYQRAVVQLVDESTATQFVESLNGSVYEKHRLNVTWTHSTEHRVIRKKSHYLKCVGFPVDVTQNKVLQFLYEHKLDPKRTQLTFRYSLNAEVFIEFHNVRECVDALQILNEAKYVSGKQKLCALFARYSDEAEYNESVAYSKDVVKMEEEVIRRSKCIDVANVSWDSKEEELMKLFSKCGKVARLHINHRKGLFPGTAFVEFEEETSSEKAILEYNGYALNGHALKINMHLKQTREDKKRIKAWYREQEHMKLQNNKQRKEEQAKRKKERLKRKRLKRAWKKAKRA